MNLNRSSSQFKDKMEKLDKLIDEYNNNLGFSKRVLTDEGILDGLIIGTGDTKNALNNNRFTMFIDRWGTSTRKVGI